MKKFLEKHLPKKVITLIRLMFHPKQLADRLYIRYLIKVMPQRYERIVKNLKGKETIKVAFFAIHSSVWKYDYLYKLMAEHPRFDPIIVVCPVVNYGHDNMLAEMEKCYQRFNDGNYNVVRTYDQETDTYLDVKNEINPDIVFYTNPYKGLIDDRYYITNYLDRLTCYVSYNFGNSNAYGMFHNQPIHNLVWRFYAETDLHRILSVEHSWNKGVNVVASGYPGIDFTLDKAYVARDVWKIRDEACKRIIWAPHHSLSVEDGVYNSSCFLQYSHFFLDLLKKYEGRIQIAFKPHPLLRIRLNNLWGKEITDDYYNMWESASNGFLSDSDYEDLFLTSDAMIHDCGSFLAEYLYTRKPVMRTYNDVDPEPFLNSFANECLSVYYKGYNESQVEQFIVNLINGVDELSDNRNAFYDKILAPADGMMPSQNILNDIFKELD